MHHAPRRTVASEALEPRTMFDSAFPNVNVSRSPGDHAEGAISIDPTNPAHLFAASNAPGVGLSASTSADGGATWTSRALFDTDSTPGAGGLPAACCDPSVAFDSFGNLFVAYAHDRGEGVEVAVSADGGQTFTSAGRFGGHLDQPTVATGPGAVWVTFQHNGSIDAAGAPITGRGSVGPFTSFRIPGSGGGNFGDVAVGAAGQVAVTFQKGAKVGVSVDPDGLGPAHFGKRVWATATHVGGFDRIPAQQMRGIDAEAALAFDRSASSGFAGRLYLLYTDENPAGSDNTDILLRYSDTSGATWSAPARVNADTGLNSQFLPRMAADDATGELAFSWYDTRDDPGTADTNGKPNDDAEFFASRARPTAEGMMLGNEAQVSAGASNADAADNGIDLGDYTGLAFFGGTIYPLWADNSNSTGDNPDGRLHDLEQYTARVAAADLPLPASPALGQIGASAGAVLDQRGSPRSLGGKTEYRFRVRYSAAAGINPGSIDGTELLVTSAAYTDTADVVSSRVGRGGVVTVTYTAAAPHGGRWTSASNGVYTLFFRPGLVLDTVGSPLPGGVLGTFVVRTSLA